ncbi:hypothetical protein EDB85DRAFT_1889374 [Lactarius pseudohatsudake]|nr:hypothetical protein EDB85DRAFT_1889374 [Lactarius pseudohatsudake]
MAAKEGGLIRGGVGREVRAGAVAGADLFLAGAGVGGWAWGFWARGFETGGAVGGTGTGAAGRGVLGIPLMAPWRASSQRLRESWRASSSFVKVEGGGRGARFREHRNQGHSEFAKLEGVPIVIDSRQVSKDVIDDVYLRRSWRGASHGGVSGRGGRHVDDGGVYLEYSIYTLLEMIHNFLED